jgi:hypothetical protein
VYLVQSTVSFVELLNADNDVPVRLYLIEKDIRRTEIIYTMN